MFHRLRVDEFATSRLVDFASIFYEKNVFRCGQPEEAAGEVDSIWCEIYRETFSVDRRQAIRLSTRER